LAAGLLMLQYCNYCNKYCNRYCISVTGCMLSIARGIAILLGLKYCNTWKQCLFDVKHTFNRKDVVSLCKESFHSFVRYIEKDW